MRKLILAMLAVAAVVSVAAGIILTILAQALCYGAAWGIWWMRKR